MTFLFQLVLLMVQKSQTTTWGCKNKPVNNGISTTNFNWLAGFLNHQQGVMMHLTSASVYRQVCLWVTWWWISWTGARLLMMCGGKSTGTGNGWLPLASPKGLRMGRSDVINVKRLFCLMADGKNFSKTVVFPGIMEPLLTPSSPCSMLGSFR